MKKSRKAPGNATVEIGELLVQVQHDRKEKESMSIHGYFIALATFGLALGAGVSSAEEAAAPPLSKPERSAICLTAAALGAAAAAVESQGCDATVGRFDVKVETFDNGPSWITVDGTTLTATLSPNAEGFVCHIKGPEKGYIDNIELRRYQASARFENEYTTLSGDSEFVLGADAVKQHLAENLIFNRSAESNRGPRVLAVTGEGLTEIAMPDLPPAKWRNSFEYTRPGNMDGRYRAESIQTESNTNTGAGCKIIFTASVDNLAQGFQSFGGQLEVMQQ